MGMKEAADAAVKTCLNVKQGETFLVITDTEKENIGKALFEAGLDVGAEALLALMKPRTRHGEEPPRAIAELWKSVDVFLVPTRFSLTHTQARKNATDAGARGATMPGITEEMFLETMGIDYVKVQENCEKMKRVLEGAKEIRVKSRLGTDVVFSVEGRSPVMDTGMLHRSSDFGNLPAGEVFIAPVEGTANGVIFFDGSVAEVGVLTEPMKVEVKDGNAVRVSGGGAEQFKKILERAGKEAYNIAEIGVGCNFGARIVGNILEDEKVYETIHIAFGDNSTIGGKVKAGIHLDGLIKKATLIVDGREAIKDGKWLV
ncbi:MAG: aminopeptidase [Candidatus Hodarchaeaceae archaeon]|nr:aminopeptidase [Candidatus Hodarchaeaceae archaeon]